MEISKCLGCMERFHGYPCPRCGFDPRREKRTEYALPMQTILAGKYLTGKVLGQGGFGITYIGWDISLAQKVAIKEYYPTGQVSRSPGTRTLTWYTGEKTQNAYQEGMKSFVKEAGKMDKVSEIPNVVRIQSMFQENNTAYIVMDYVEGQTLKSRLKENGPMTWEQTRKIFEPVIKAMKLVHEAGLVHRDLSPDNLMLTRDGDVKILDLGAAKDLNISSGESSMQVAKNGFSPLEQYGRRGGSGTWTDVYALAATIYYTLTGKVPPNAVDRLEKDELQWDHPGLKNVPPYVVSALQKAMEVQSKNRTKTMEKLDKGLFPKTLGSSSGRDKKPKTEIRPKTEVRPRTEVRVETNTGTNQKPPKWLIPAIVTVAAALCATGFWFFQKTRTPSLGAYDTKETTEAATADSTETIADTTVITEATTVPATTQHSHTFTDAWDSDAEYHWHSATCGHTDVVEDKQKHSWDAGVMVIPATHTDEGKKTYTCTVCDANRSVVISTDANAHVFDREVMTDQYLASAATPSTPTAYYKSCSCGEKGTELFYYGDSVPLKTPERGSSALWQAIGAGMYHTVGLKSNGRVEAVGSNGDGQCDVGGWRGIVAISAGSCHTVGLKSDGDVVAAGENDSRQCNVSGWWDVVAIDAGMYHTIGLKSDGSVVATGENGSGQCNVSGWWDIVAVSAGSYHTIGLKSNGTVVAAGWKEYGQCDVGEWTDIVAVGAGAWHTVGLKSDGTVVAVGDNNEGQCDVSGWKDIVAISVGNAHTVGLKADGTLVAVGDNGQGQCDVSGWMDVVAVSAGIYHTVGLKSDGTLVSTSLPEGHSFDNGQCEVSDWTGIRTDPADVAPVVSWNPFPLSVPERGNTVAWETLSAGDGHTVGLQSDGTAVAVGRNSADQCDVYGWTGLTAVSAGSYHTVGLKSDGTVVAVGNGIFDQCDVKDWRSIVAISAGYCHTVGLKSGGTVVAVGSNKDLDGNWVGQCSVTGWWDIVAVSAGAYHTVGLKSNGTVVAVGDNDYGQCNVSGWRDIVAISAGNDYTVGLKSDGTVVAVGSKNSGDFSSWEDIVAISAGTYHTVGLKADGTVVAVGHDKQGQCDVSDWTDIVAVSAGTYHTVGLRADGSVVSTNLPEDDNRNYGQSDISGWTEIRTNLTAR